MTMPSLIWGTPHWMTGALVLLGIATAAILWSYARAGTRRSVEIRRGDLESPRVHGPGDQLARSSPGGHAATSRGERICDPGR